MNVVLRYEKITRDNDRMLKRWGQWGKADYQIKRQLFLNHSTKIQFSKAELRVHFSTVTKTVISLDTVISHNKITLK